MPTDRLVEANTTLLDAATFDQIDRANDAVTANLDDIGVPKYDSAFGYACALTAIMQCDVRLVKALEALEAIRDFAHDDRGDLDPYVQIVCHSRSVAADALAQLKQER